MKILLFIDNLGSGGAQRQLVTLSKLLKKEGFDVSFLIYGNADFYQQDIKKENILINKIVTSKYLIRIFKVRRFIRKGNYDVVISFLDVPNFLNCFAAIGGKKWKVITNERSSKESTFLSRRGRIFGWFQKYSDAIVTNSYNAMNMWKKYYPQYEKKLSVIYNAVVLPPIHSEYKVRKNGKTNIIIAASYQYLKNPIGVVKAMTLLSKSERDKVKITWYGSKKVSSQNAKAYEEAKQLIEKNNLKESICLKDATLDIYEKMQKADVVGLFSELEGLPNVICEGMMIGKPIVMTRVSDYSLLVDEQNGFLCDWDNPNSIKEALIGVSNLSNDELLEMGSKSKTKAEKMFIPSNIVKQWKSVIKDK